MMAASLRRLRAPGLMAAAVFFSRACLAAEPTATVVEFYNVDIKHYFMTASPAEAAAIDQGAAGPGWIRTGSTISAFSGPDDAAGLVPVCRFLGAPGIGPNRHFYTADASECAYVKTFPAWIYEGIAFYVFPFQGVACQAGATPVYRVYNSEYANRDAGHRYLTDYTMFANMVTQGISPEGIAMCAPLSSAQKLADANRLLQQASFGPTEPLAQYVASIGAAAWIEQQFAATATHYPDYPYTPATRPDACVNNTAPPLTATSYCARDNYSLFPLQLEFFKNALNNPDQLRQRVAFALSQIVVTSGVENSRNYAMARYQQMLLDKAFGNYEDILKAVTVSPMMGDYLNMANNDKPDAAKGYSPNENYARELLQLFSIGLTKLKPDGTPLLGADGKTLPTYGQSEVTNFAHVFTGWTYPAPPGVLQSPINFNFAKTYTADMVPLANHHDGSAKTLLDGLAAPAGLDIASDMNNAVHSIFMHPNLGPFIGKRLIQKLVNGNPSPGYVARVAAAFDNNGNGVRGDMKALIRAILLDPEARGDAKLDPDYGKLREPVLYMTTLARALGASSDGVYFQQQGAGMGQALFYSPSVFNYYSPGYTVPGTKALGPEFQLLDTSSAVTRINVANSMLFSTIAPSASVYGATGTQFDWTPLQALASNPAALADKLSVLMLNGTMSAQMKAAIVSAVNAVAASDTLNRARTAVYLVAASPQFQVER